jgi:hypothetical protein
LKTSAVIRKTALETGKAMYLAYNIKGKYVLYLTSYPVLNISIPYHPITPPYITRRHNTAFIVAVIVEILLQLA